MAPRCPCALPGPCVGKPSEAQSAGAAQGIGRDGTRIMAATLTWLMQTKEAGIEGFFATHPATDDRTQGVKHSQKAMTRETS
jgi:hypothetical protein